MAAGKLICFGDLCVDVAGKVGKISTGSDVTLDSLSVRAAGAAVNCAIAAAGEGIEVQLVGLLSDDMFSDLLRTRLTGAGVGTEHVRTQKGATGMVISIVDSDGQTKLYSYRGVNAQAYGDLPSGLVEASDLVYLSGYSFQENASRLTAERLVACGSRCALDPSFQYARDFKISSPNLEFLLPNLEEARLMTGRGSVEDCAASLRKHCARAVVVKLGGDGCYIDCEGGRQFVKSKPVAAVDTTGAGDSFAGVFLAGILHGHGIVEAAERANEVARDLVTRER